MCCWASALRDDQASQTTLRRRLLGTNSVVFGGVVGRSVLAIRKRTSPGSRAVVAEQRALSAV